LGHILSDKGISTNPEKVQAVRDWNVPKSTKELQSFLGLVGWYQEFISHYADIACL